jgi:hypothetical protein
VRRPRTALLVCGQPAAGRAPAPDLSDSLVVAMHDDPPWLRARSFDVVGNAPR